MNKHERAQLTKLMNDLQRRIATMEGNFLSQAPTMSPQLAYQMASTIGGFESAADMTFQTLAGVLGRVKE